MKLARTRDDTARADTAGPGTLPETRKRCAGRLPLLSIALVSTLLACKKDAEPPSMQAEPQEIYHYTPAAPVYNQSPPDVSPSTEPTPLRSPPASLPVPRTLDEALGRLEAAGYGMPATVIRNRVNQERPKMKLSQEDGLHAASYLLADLPSMPNSRALLAVMPKTTIELLRSVHERGVTRQDAEEMAAYLVRLRESLRMQNPAPFDENCSHAIGREWHQIDYSGEGMTWQGQKAHYAPGGVPDFKTVGHLRRFFEIESRMRYFNRLYRPEGGLPE